MSYQYNDLTVYYVGGADSPIKSNQSTPVRYEDIKAQYSKDNLYEDPDFPASFESIGELEKKSIEPRNGLNYIWSRPKEVCQALRVDKPDFAVCQKARDGSELGIELCSDDDVLQGELGDCWFLCAIAGLTKIPKQVKVVIPEDNLNGFDDDKYCGAFHFRRNTYRFYSLEESKWVDIVVDDRLPTNKDKRIVFTRVANFGAKTAEFWPALIEKAYAKFIGSYAKIVGGNPAFALEHLTNGFGQIFNLKTDLPNYGLVGIEKISKYDRIKTMILAHLNKGYFLGLSTYGDEAAADKDGALAGYAQLGLLTKHAYSILDGQPLTTKDGSSLFLVKIRNPHAQTEWKGDYSDEDDLNWSNLDKDLRTKNVSGSTNINEGTFWMDLNDVIKYFSYLQTCMYGLEEGEKFTSLKSEWPASLQTKSVWTAPKDYVHFPTFKFEVAAGSGATANEQYVGSNALLALQVVLHGYNSIDSDTPKFYVSLYKVSQTELDSGGSLVKSVYLKKKPIIRNFKNLMKSITLLTPVPPGLYVLVVILQTLETTGVVDPPIPAHLKGKPIPFTIRLFTENQTEITQIQ